MLLIINNLRKGKSLSLPLLPIGGVPLKFFITCDLGGEVHWQVGRLQCEIDVVVDEKKQLLLI